MTKPLIVEIAVEPRTKADREHLGDLVRSEIENPL